MKYAFNLLDPDARGNLYPMYAEIRRKSPVCQVDPGGLWVLSRYDDVLFALKHPELFSSQGMRAGLLPPWLDHNPMVDSLIVTDPPEHARTRAVVNKAFTARILGRIEPRIRDTARALADGLARAGKGDFLADFAIVLTSRIIAELLGLDPELHAKFKIWNDAFAMISPIVPSPDVVSSIRAAIAELESYLGRVVAARRESPKEDLASALVTADVVGEPLSDREIVGMLSLTLIAGFDTTTALLANSVLGLIERPADLDRLRRDAAAFPGFVEEVLRHDPPGHCIMRLTTESVEVSGVAIPAGAPVGLLLASANRDERKFPDPDRFDMDRSSTDKLSFGHGVHFCVGAALARLEARIALEALVARFTRFERLTRDLTWNGNFLAPAPLALPLRFVPV